MSGITVERPAGIRSEPGRTGRPHVRIRPSRGWRALDLGELWVYRDLVYFLSWRDVKVRYKQTALGITWALLQPLAAMAVFTLFLGNLVGVPSGGVPYSLFALTGLMPWTFFANSTAAAGSSLVANTNLVAKVYFPRLVIPLSAVLAGLVDLAIGLLLLIAVVAISAQAVGPQLLALPLCIAMLTSAAFAVAVWLSALDVQYRDVRYAIPFLIQVWLFATPVVYPASVVPDQFKLLYALNPMTGVVEFFRWSVLGSGPFPVGLVAISSAVIFAILVTGLIYFRRMERIFADVI
jgi:lipopolysaccharide transport system permease protein